MKKPIVIAKHQGIDWFVGYTDIDSGEQRSITIFGSPTVEDALAEAKRSLDADRQNWYAITDIYVLTAPHDAPDEP